uniref:Uncharacterized protein n=1 Tax=Heterorhabditis bacteriophora TaxID=37862 RepID=A0A1I7X2J7_HETBA
MLLTSVHSLEVWTKFICLRDLSEIRNTYVGYKLYEKRGILK